MSFTILIHILFPFFRSNFFLRFSKQFYWHNSHAIHFTHLRCTIQYFSKKKKKSTSQGCAAIFAVQSLSHVWLFANPKACSTPGFPVHNHLLELVQTQVHGVSDAIQPSHPLSSPSPPTFNLSHYQGHFQWVSSSHQVAKVLELQLRHQSFQWIFRVDSL